MMIPYEHLVIGQVVHVHWDDCCAGGRFDSAVSHVEIYHEPDGDGIDWVTFTNGVRLQGSNHGTVFLSDSADCELCHGRVG